MSRASNQSPYGVVRTIDLSVDFDFFTREVASWDWGHRDDALMQTLVWKERYASRIDVYDETSIAKHADFLPSDLISELHRKGVVLFPTDAWTARAPLDRLVVTDSHAEAYALFKETGPADALLHLDAHHDCWKYGMGNKVDCGNWLTALLRLKAWRDTPVVHVYPKWKNQREDGPKRTSKVGSTLWSHWPGFVQRHKVNVRHIFLCRSGGWVAPHHDEDFLRMARGLAIWPKRTLEFSERMIDRREYVLTRAESKKLRLQRQRAFKKLREQEQQQQEKAAV